MNTYLFVEVIKDWAFRKSSLFLLSIVCKQNALQNALHYSFSYRFIYSLYIIISMALNLGWPYLKCIIIISIDGHVSFLSLFWPPFWHFTYLINYFKTISLWILIGIRNVFHCLILISPRWLMTFKSIKIREEILRIWKISDKLNLIG